MESTNPIVPSITSITAASTSLDTRTYAEKKLDEVTTKVDALTAKIDGLRARRYELLKKPKDERDESEQAELDDFGEMKAEKEAMEKEKEGWFKRIDEAKVSSVNGILQTKLESLEKAVSTYIQKAETDPNSRDD
ncbi:UNVERIFIED_CONTAM: hypothetical protein HDU68_005548 [Siphonaria sp. JEL0065]|nr:hypothetical protein HDU68_005548 [Siphonaria sp. JEL0065]